MTKQDQVSLAKCDALLTKAEAVRSTAYLNDSGGSWVDSGRFAEWRSQCLTFLRAIVGDKHTYATEFNKQVFDPRPWTVRDGIGILHAVHEDIDGGHLRSLHALVAAEVFADFLEMAEYLLDEGYKDAAAVIVGSSLESHLRRLCEMHGTAIEIGGKPKKADTLNADLAKAGAYNKLDQKSVTGWLGLRNNAAHGDYDQYTSEQVKVMLAGVTDFIARHPA